MGTVRADHRHALEIRQLYGPKQEPMARCRYGLAHDPCARNYLEATDSAAHALRSARVILTMTKHDVDMFDADSEE